jgi:hypothetical protein
MVILQYLVFERSLSLVVSTAGDLRDGASHVTNR